MDGALRRRDASRLTLLLDALDGPRTDERSRARDELFRTARERMQTIAHRMLRTFRGVRRWDDTDDVVQEALIRLHRALESTTVVDGRHFLALAAIQVRRQLLDLARHYSGSSSFAAHHDSDAGDGPSRVAVAVDERAADPDALAVWARFHEIVAGLPDEERRLFDLVWYLGAEQGDIATLLGCSTRTVRRRWDSTKRLLIARLGGDLPE